MADQKKPTKTDNKVVKSADTPVSRHKLRPSAEIDFIVRREHRRQHREDRAL